MLLLLPLLLQVETRACFEALDDVLSVPGIDCAFLGEQLYSITLHSIACGHQLVMHTAPTPPLVST
jgi:2-keto-3-deoxy-L-rhamnonate aldolase RhmA